MLGQMGPEQDVIHIMSQEAVVDIRGHARVVHRKLPQRRLHPVKARRLPHKVDNKVGAAIDGRALRWKSQRIKIHRLAYRFFYRFLNQYPSLWIFLLEIKKIRQSLETFDSRIFS